MFSQIGMYHTFFCLHVQLFCFEVRLRFNQGIFLIKNHMQVVQMNDTGILKNHSMIVEGAKYHTCIPHLLT